MREPESGSMDDGSLYFKVAPGVDLRSIPEPSFTVFDGHEPALRHVTVEELEHLLNGLKCPDCGDEMVHAWHNTPAGESHIGCSFPVGTSGCASVRIVCEHNAFLVYPNQRELEDHRAVMGKYAEDVEEMASDFTP